MKFTMLEDTSRVILTVYSVILHFNPKVSPLEVGGHELYNYLCPYPTDGKYQIWLKVAE